MAMIEVSDKKMQTSTYPLYKNKHHASSFPAKALKDVGASHEYNAVLSISSNHSPLLPLQRMKQLMKQASQPLGFIIFLPAPSEKPSGEEEQIFSALNSSPCLVKTITAKPGHHGYVHGAQHAQLRRHVLSDHGTGIYFLQNKGKII